MLSALALGVMTVSATTIPNDAETVRHVLNRITFGPRDSDVERVNLAKMGMLKIPMAIMLLIIPGPRMEVMRMALSTAGNP